MFFILALVQALADAPDPVLAGALFCLGDQPLPETFTREAPDKEIWRRVGSPNIHVSKVGPACLVIRLPVGEAETAMSAWIETRPDFQLDKDATAAGTRTREYVRKSRSGRLRLRLIEPAASEYPAFSPPSGVVIWTDPSPE